MKNAFEYEAELAALQEELARLKEVTNFKDAVACVFDMLKYAACNTSDKQWDDQLEELAEDVIEFAPEYKKQWKDIGMLSASLTTAEKRNSELSTLLRRASAFTHDLLNPISLRRDINAALKPAESGAIE